MFWFRLLPFMGTLSILMGEEGQHLRRTWRAEAVGWILREAPTEKALWHK